MKLIVDHKEIISGLVMYLESRGMTGFDLNKVHAEFSLARGTKELSAVLDDDYVVPADEPKDPVATAKPEAAAQASAQVSGANAVAEAEKKPATAVTIAEEAVAEAVFEVDEQAATTKVAEAEVQPEPAAAVAEAEAEENLFG